MQWNASACRCGLLLSFLIACGGIAQAQSTGPDGDARNQSPSSPDVDPPSRPATGFGASADVQETRPTQAECWRLQSEQPAPNAGGTIDEDTQAKLQKCRELLGSGARR